MLVHVLLQLIFVNGVNKNVNLYHVVHLQHKIHVIHYLDVNGVIFMDNVVYIAISLFLKKIVI